MARAPVLLAAALSCALAGCVAQGPLPGTPEFAASRVSRGYDCGVRVDRARVIATLPRDERQRFLAASATYAVSAYKAPRSCDGAERTLVQREIALLTGR